MTDQVSSAHLLDVARDAARKAGKQARDMFHEPRQIRNKGYRDVVTDADVAAQATITETIRAAFPDHGFLTEEEDSELPQDGPILWVIDPIDGTTNYSRGLPIFCVSVAAMRNEQPWGLDKVLAGVVYDPMLDELFTVTAGGPALLEGPGLHGRPLQVSPIANLEDAVLGLDWSLGDAVRQQGQELIAWVGHEVTVVRALGSATLAIAWVAAGRLDVYANFQLRPWDVAAAGLLVRQAGGVVTDAAGRPLIMDPDGSSCVVGNPLLAGQLVDRL